MQAAIADKPFLELTAEDLMTTPVITIPQHMSLREAARRLDEADISGAPVVNATGRCLGILSARDFVRRTVGLKEPERFTFIGPHGDLVTIDEPDDCEVCQYMTADMVMVAPGTSVRELAQKMIDAHIHRILVVDADERPCGIVTSTDILAAVAKSPEE